MADKNMILVEIEVLRDRLSSLIQAKGELLDPEVIEASILLDEALNAYNEIEQQGSGIIMKRKIS
jgi:hypothetical protein